MTAHEKEVLKRWGFPALMILVVGLVWWYFYKRGQALVVASNIPNASGSGAPVYNYYGVNGQNPTGTSTGNIPAPTSGITTQTPQSNVTPSGAGPNQVAGGTPDISRLIYNTPNAFVPPSNLLTPSNTLPMGAGGSGSGGCGCCGGCGGECNGGGTTRYTDSSNTILAATSTQQGPISAHVLTSSGIGGVQPGPADWMYQNQIAMGIAQLGGLPIAQPYNPNPIPGGPGGF